MTPPTLFGEVNTRQAREDDLPVLAVFERELAKLSFPDDPIMSLAYHQAKLVRALRAEPEGMIVLTGEEDEDIVGWLWLTTKTTLATKERYGLLRSLYVRHDLRRQGFASTLVTYAQRYFDSRGIARVVAKVHVDSESGQRLLSGSGFKPLHLTYEWRKEKE